jgi:hypothetical protein
MHTSELASYRLSDSAQFLVMHAAQHYVCFLQFDISEEYLADLESPSPKSFMYAWSTPWYDMSWSDEKSHFVRVMCAIMKYAITT